MSRYKLPYSLYKRGKYWYYRTYDASGNRTVAKSTGLTNKNAAISYLNQLYKKDQLFITDITFNDYAEHFLDSKSPFIIDRTHKLTANTLHGYRNCLAHLLRLLNGKKLVDINYTELKKLRATLFQLKLSSSTITQIFSLLRKIILTAYKDNIIIKNPFEGLEAIKNTSKSRDAFTLGEVKFLYDSMTIPEYKNIILLLALTGMRISEGIGVRLSDISLSDNLEYIDLKHQLLKHKYEVLKNKQARVIPIIPEIKEILLKEEISPPKFYRYFIPLQRKCDKADDRGLCVHSLRHFFITNAKSKGINPLKVEKIAGHTLKGIQNVYTNFNAQDLSDILSWQKEILEYITKK